MKHAHQCQLDINKTKLGIHTRIIIVLQERAEGAQTIRPSNTHHNSAIERAEGVKFRILLSTLPPPSQFNFILWTCMWQDRARSGCINSHSGDLQQSHDHILIRPVLFRATNLTLD
eukprot:1161383-Pelagomonas_calceolata.AAC.6